MPNQPTSLSAYSWYILGGGVVEFCL